MCINKSVKSALCKSPSYYLKLMGFQSSELTHSSLYDRVKKLLVSFEWSDCCFSISGKDFKAHKLILGISSPVFEAMFYGPMSSNNTIVIEDIEPETFQLLLNYIYTDKADFSSIEEAFELLYASRKYILEELSHMCIAYIQANISIDNVIAILNYPEYMQDKELISSTQKLFCEHANYLLENNKKLITTSCLKTVLESNNMNVKEKHLIKQIFDWTLSYCEQHNIPTSIENRRDVLIHNGLFKLLRFPTLTIDELEEVYNDANNLLLQAEYEHFKKIIVKESTSINSDVQVEKSQDLDSTSPRGSLKLQWHMCHRLSLRSVAPINIDSNNCTIHSRIKANKPVFITSLCIPTRMSPVLNFRNDIAKAYSEQISVSLIDEADNSVIKFTNFMNTVEYDAMVDIELSEPCFIKRDKHYKISFTWPENRYLTYSYVVECRERRYKDQKVAFEFEDLHLLPGNSGSFLCGLKYCL